MTKITSIFDHQGCERIVTKTDAYESLPIDSVTRVGYLEVVRKREGDKRVKKTFLLTKNYLYYVHGNVKEVDGKLCFQHKAKIEFAWVLGMFKIDEGIIFEKPSFTIQFVKKKKTVQFRVKNQEEFDYWKSALADLTIQRDFFNDFKVLSLLGEGSSAKVYKVEEKSTGMVYACKRFCKKNMTQPMVKSLIDEIRVLRKLKGCAFIIELFKIYESDNSVYLIFELCEGGRCVKRRAFYKEKQLKHLMYQIFKALQEMRNLSIVHRDLKPDNILLKYKDKPLEENEIRIIDFGLSIFSYETENIREGGTIGYMAPESLTKHNYFPDYQFDMYAVGVIAYNSITGSKLFKDKKYSRMIEKNKAGKVNFFDDIFLSQSDDFQQLLQGLLKTDEKKRTNIYQALKSHAFLGIGDNKVRARTGSKRTIKENLTRVTPNFKISVLKTSPIKSRGNSVAESNSSQLMIPNSRKARRESIQVQIPNLPPQGTLSSWFMSSKNMSSNNMNNNSELNFPAGQTQIQRKKSDSDTDSDTDSDSEEDHQTAPTIKIKKSRFHCIEGPLNNQRKTKKSRFHCIEAPVNNRRKTKKSTFFIRSKANIY